MIKTKTFALLALVISTGNPNDYYEQSGMHAALIRVNDEGIFGFCGIDSSSIFFGNIAMGSDELRNGYLESIV